MRGQVLISDAVNWQSSLNDGLVSWWTALPGQQRGNAVRDLTRRNDGTLNGGALLRGPQGRRGGYGSWKFDGTDDYANLNLADAITGQFANCYWLKVSAPTDYMIALGDDPTDYYHQFVTNVLYIVFYSNATFHQLTMGDLNDNKWHHIGFVYTGANIYGYIDGKQVATDTATGTIDSSGIEGLGFGGLHAAGGNYLACQMDDVRLHSGACFATRQPDAWIREVYKDSLRGNWEGLNWQVDSDYGGEQAAGVSDISGTCALVFGAGSSTLVGAGALAGTCALSFGAGSSTLAGAGALAGTAALVFDDGSSTLAGAGALAGSSALVFAAGSSTLTGAGVLAGSAAIIFGEGSSTLTSGGTLSGTCALAFAAGSSTLIGTSALTGTAAMAFGEGASLLSGSAALVGSAATIFGAGSSTLTGAGALTGAAAIQFALSGILADLNATYGRTCMILNFMTRTEYTPEFLTRTEYVPDFITRTEHEPSFGCD